MPKYFPIFLDIRGKPCLVVGGGEIATHKASQLLKYGPRLTIVAPTATAAILDWAGRREISYAPRAFQPADVDGKTLVVSATNDKTVDAEVSEAAMERGVLVNIADVPELCSFVYGAIVERGDLQIVVSTSGRSPAFAAHLKRDLEHQFGEEYAQYLDILGEARLHTRRTLPDLKQQQAAYRKLLSMDLLGLLREGRADEARRKALECISPSSD